MQKHPRLTETRVGRLLQRIGLLIHGPFSPVKLAMYEVGGEPIPAADAIRRDYRPVTVGDPWGCAWDTTWFRISGTIPVEWAGREVVALVKLGYQAGEGFTSEALVWQDGLPTRAINVNRADIPLANPAQGGEAFLFHLEAAANPKASEHLLQAANAPTNGIGGTPIFRIDQAELACFDREMFNLYHDFRVAYETMIALPDNGTGAVDPGSPRAEAIGAPRLSDPRRGQFLYALNEVCNVFDEHDRTTIAGARALLREGLSRNNGPSAHRISAIGHAHIDTAWLWPLRETIRKCARTFSTALAYMREYPEYVFGCSQPQQYAWMKAYYPSIFEGIKEAVKRGQWEPIGSMWIEADCNLASGEALVRQILHGKNFFLDEFGCETRDVWIPDVFGYSASMPQILRKAGVDYFVTQKICWNQFNKFPHHTFLWEGIDGTRVFSHFPPGDTYNASFEAKHLVYNVQNFRDNDRATRSLYVYGFGDGGGGPTRQMLESAARLKDLEGLPRVELERVCDFLPKAQQDARDLPVWVGELYLELHRGTLTTQARNKLGNRKSEFLLRDAEFFDAVAAAARLPCAGVAPCAGERAVYDVTRMGESPSAAGYLDRAWKLLLLNQFHDIIPGSSIDWVYRDSARDYATIRELGEAVLQDARHALAHAIDSSAFQSPAVIFNTAPHRLESVLDLPGAGLRLVAVPACGYAVVETASHPPLPPSISPVIITQTDGRITLDNGILCVVIAPNGCLQSVFDHRANREVLASGGLGNVLHLHDDRPNHYDAWDIDLFYKEKCVELIEAQSVEVTEAHELRARVRIVREFGKSRVVQSITLEANSPRIDFETEVDWQEEYKLLKAAFPVAIRAARATYEIQYGHTERPTHSNTSWDMAQFEVCAQKWVDLSEGDYGVALLNDCKYGHDIAGNVIRLSLLRSPTAPDPGADRGHHRFTYSLLPHPGDFRAGRVVEQAYALNIPPSIVLIRPHAGPMPPEASLFSVNRAGIVIEAIKKAEREDEIVVRLYESHGTRGAFTLKTVLPFAMAARADLMERSLDAVPFDGGELTLSIAPFEIVTLKFSGFRG